ncbi:diaminopimelate epimerase [Acetobacteraceae bacterium]|nr:diaminopimelate epimerase [Acetobacteraceae bacterium]
MCKVQFYKMEALGNDFVLFDGRDFSQDQISNLIKKENLLHIADRRLGIGCDQIILLTCNPSSKTPHFIRFFNQDGSEAGACGNGSRAIILYLSLCGEKNLSFQTSEGLITGKISGETISVFLPPPSFDASKIPMKPHLKGKDVFSDIKIKTWQQSYACSIGNPHATLFFETPDIALNERKKLGKILEHHADFPERVNIGFASLVTPHHLKLYVWERGAGMTYACGTGACAASINAIFLEMAQSPVKVEMEGGTVCVEWDRKNASPILLSGTAHFCYQGIIKIPSFTRG